MMGFGCCLYPSYTGYTGYTGLIILDNAPYHNVVVEEAFPTPTSRKEQLCAWLTKNGIPWTPDMLKPELYDLCKIMCARSGIST
jgi:hypothetical protein